MDGSGGCDFTDASFVAIVASRAMKVLGTIFHDLSCQCHRDGTLPAFVASHTKIARKKKGTKRILAILEKE
jgi:hypothetical protein